MRQNWLQYFVIYSFSLFSLFIRHLWLFIVCVWCTCGVSDVEHSKAALVIAVSASTEKGLSDSEGDFQSPYISLCSEAVVCLPAWESKCKGPGHSECTFKYLNYSRCQFISDTWTVLGMGMKQNQAAPVLFKYLKWTPEFFIKRLVNLKLWNVSVLFWPGLVSVCLTRATVFKRTSRGSSTLSETACVAKKNLNKIFWTK